MKDRKNKVKQPYAFTGREWDREAKLYYYRARYYDAGAGRFISRDPMGFADGNNTYIYAKNNPIRNNDPFGLIVINGWSCHEIGKKQLPVITKGVPYRTESQGWAWICTGLVIEDSFSCGCVYEKYNDAREYYERYLAFEVTYKCVKEERCKTFEMIFKKIETEQIDDIVRLLRSPTGLTKIISGTTTGAFSGCSCAPLGIGSQR